MLDPSRATSLDTMRQLKWDIFVTTVQKSSQAEVLFNDAKLLKIWMPENQIKRLNSARMDPDMAPGDWQQVEVYKHASLLLEDGEQIVDPKDAEQQSIKYANGTF